MVARKQAPEFINKHSAEWYHLVSRFGNTQPIDKVSIHATVFMSLGKNREEFERNTMFSDLPNLDRYFDLAEHLALRASLLIFLLLALYRIIEGEFKRR